MRLRQRIESLRERGPYRVAVLLALCAFTATAMLLALRFGSLRLRAEDIITILLGGGTPVQRQIVLNVRLPRNIAAALVGVCLSVAGVILQGVMRNPLAAPNIIGVTGGGGLAAMIILIALPRYFQLLVPAAFIGALAATALIYALAWKRGVLPGRMILAGVAVSSLLGAFINALMVFFPDRVSGVVDFMVGGLSGRSWKHVAILWPYCAAGTLGALAFSKHLNILALGDEVATSLGIDVERTRATLIALSSLLAGAAVSVAGLLGFVGLIAPHMMRLVIGSDHRFLVPASALFSAGLLVGCDTLGRMILDPVELPVGIIMAILGAPFFLFLLRARRRHVA
jgi:iron complex transport system permease protein